MIHPRCCGIPGCGYGSRQPRRPDPLVSSQRPGWVALVRAWLGR